MGSARAELPADQIFGSLSGNIGTTQRKSLVWIARTSTFHEFLQIICDLLILLERTLTSGETVDRPYPWLATERRGLSGVGGAYELTALSVDEVPRTPGWPEEALQAAALLERAVIDVRGDASSPDFVASVGLDGSFGGKIRCTVDGESGTVKLKFGWDPASAPTDERSVQMVLGALQFTDLITVYYESGEAINSGNVWSTETRPFPFPNWVWRDFSGFDVRREKPEGGKPQEIHDAIGEAQDRSLFSWVVSTYGASGWLTCDDGPGEISDFIKYDGDGAVSLVHVKAANSDNPKRPVNVTSFEVVMSQATKNLTYLNTDQLIERLSTPGVPKPASWYAGSRVGSRMDLIDFLSVRPAQAPLRVEVIQPQMTRRCYERATAMPEGSIDLMRLRLLETLLNAARGVVTGLGADLYVVGSS